METEITESLLRKSTGFLSVFRGKLSAAMATASDRLRQARIEAGNRTAADAIKKHRWPGSTYRSHENGQTPPPPEWTEKYASAYNVRAGWITYGEEPKRRVQPSDLPEQLAKIDERLGQLEKMTRAVRPRFRARE